MESCGDNISSEYGRPSDGGAKAVTPITASLCSFSGSPQLQGSPAFSSSMGDAPTGNSAGDRVWWAGVREDAAGMEKGTTASLLLGVLAEQGGSSSGGLGRGVWPARS